MGSDAALHELKKSFQTHGLTFDSQPSTMIAGETRKFARLLLQNPNLLLQLLEERF